MDFALTHRRKMLLLLTLCMVFAFLTGTHAAQSRVYLTKKKLTMMAGQQKRIRLKGASGKVAWSSSDEAVATVLDGRITAVAEGTCEITAHNSGKKYICAVTVQEITLSQTDISLLRRRRVHLTVEGSDEEPVWRSSRPAVASVDENGNVTGKKLGRCSITAQIDDIILSCSVRVIRRSSSALNTFYSDVSTEKKRILLCGSSSIDQWQTAYEAFAPYEIANVGIGGTTVKYWIKWRKRLVTGLKPKPSAVVIYIGSNDVTQGISGAVNASNTIRLLKMIRSELKNVPVFYVSIVPSWGRKSNWKAIQVSNKKMKKYCRHAKNIYYLDVASEFLDEGGRPQTDLFKGDQIHPNGRGYLLWEKVVVAKVKEVLSAKQAE